MGMPEAKQVDDTSSTFLHINIFLKKVNITIQVHSQVKFGIAAVPLCDGWIPGNENLLQWVALRDLVGS